MKVLILVFLLIPFSPVEAFVVSNKSSVKVSKSIPKPITRSTFNSSESIPRPRYRPNISAVNINKFKQGYSIKKDNSTGEGYEELILTRGLKGSDGIGWQDKQCLPNKLTIAVFEAEECYAAKIQMFLNYLKSSTFIKSSRFKNLISFKHLDFYQTEAIISRMYHKGYIGFFNTNMYKVLKIIEVKYHSNLDSVPAYLAELLIYEWLDDNKIRDSNGKVLSQHKYNNGFERRLINELKLLGKTSKTFNNRISIVNKKMKSKDLLFIKKIRKHRALYLK